MAASKDEIRLWFKHGLENGAAHMIILCDTYDHEDYPVYVAAGEDARSVENIKSKQNMVRLMEVYSMSMDMEKQLNELRSFNY